MDSCSVTCSKKHKEQPCTPAEEQALTFPAAPTNRDGTITLKQRILLDEAAAVKLSPEELRRLDGDTSVQMKLENSRLQHTLRVILDADNSMDALDMAMKEGDFLQFCDEVLNCIGFHGGESGEGGDVSMGMI